MAARNDVSIVDYMVNASGEPNAVTYGSWIPLAGSSQITAHLLTANGAQTAAQGFVIQMTNFDEPLRDFSAVDVVNTTMNATARTSITTATPHKWARVKITASATSPTTTTFQVALFLRSESR